MYRPVLDAVGGSLFLTAVLAMLPLLTLHPARRAPTDRLEGGPHIVGGLLCCGRRRLLDASRSGPRCWSGGCGLLVLPDPVDRHQRDLDLPDDRRDGTLRRLAALIRQGQ